MFAAVLFWVAVLQLMMFAILWSWFWIGRSNTLSAFGMVPAFTALLLIWTR